MHADPATTAGVVIRPAEPQFFQKHPQPSKGPFRDTLLKGGQRCGPPSALQKPQVRWKSHCGYCPQIPTPGFYLIQPCQINPEPFPIEPFPICQINPEPFPSFDSTLSNKPGTFSGTFSAVPNLSRRFKGLDKDYVKPEFSGRFVATNGDPSSMYIYELTTANLQLIKLDTLAKNRQGEHVEQIKTYLSPVRR